MAPRFLTTEEWVKRAKKKRGSRYDYSETKYADSKTPVEIICKEHGSFWQKPKDHLYGNNCPLCKKSIQTQDKFLAKVKSVWGTVYDTSLVDYKGNREPVTLICEKHGPFTINKAYRFLMGQGCPMCGRERGNQKKRITKKEFIERARHIHGNKYTYENLNLDDGIQSNLNITCKRHGSFFINGSNFLSGAGCIKCSHVYTPTEKEFLEKVKNLYGDTYDLEKIKYTALTAPISIFCENHGYVKIKQARKFLEGSGCPLCLKKNRSKGEAIISFFLKKVGIEFIEQHKFPECKLRNKLLFDFYLPTLNLCIEYQGEQHFHAVEAFGGTPYYEICKKRDKIKKEFCEKNGIQLITINYNEDIKTKLLENIPECQILIQGGQS